MFNANSLIVTHHSPHTTHHSPTPPARCHQDTVAYIGLAANHISVMVAVDEANRANGCLQVSERVSAE